MYDPRTGKFHFEIGGKEQIKIANVSNIKRFNRPVIVSRPN
jgi:hypothetical protein